MSRQSDDLGRVQPLGVPQREAPVEGCTLIGGGSVVAGKDLMHTLAGDAEIVTDLLRGFTRKNAIDDVSGTRKPVVTRSSPPAAEHPPTR